jgi:CRP/FNR family transcriptional regulator, cyclic AMP receptor protein
MIHIELDEEKGEILREVLISHVYDLRMQIAYTNRKEVREFLKQRADSLEKLLQDMEKELLAGGREMIGTDRLRKVDILEGLTDWELKIVSQFIQKENVPENYPLFTEGEKALKLFILEEGRISILMDGKQQYEINQPGKILGWSFLVSPRRYTASCLTLSPSKLLTIKSPDFYYVIHKEPQMGVKVMENLTKIIAGRYSQLRTKS